MQTLQGSVVLSLAGHDKGTLSVAVKTEDGFVFICDGKERKLEKPKRKNIKHVAVTEQKINLNEITNKKLRSLLRAMAEKMNNNSSNSQDL